MLNNLKQSPFSSPTLLALQACAPEVPHFKSWISSTIFIAVLISASMVTMFTRQVVHAILVNARKPLAFGILHWRQVNGLLSGKDGLVFLCMRIRIIKRGSVCYLLSALYPVQYPFTLLPVCEIYSSGVKGEAIAGMKRSI